MVPVDHFPSRRNVAGEQELPDSHKVLTLGGPSTGSVCAFCASEIAAGGLEIEISWRHVDGRACNASFHPKCHSNWLSALRRKEARVNVLQSD